MLLLGLATKTEKERNEKRSVGAKQRDCEAGEDG